MSIRGILFGPGIKALKRRAEQYDAAAHWELGQHYLKGIVVAKNINLAFNHFLMAASLGHAGAMTNIGMRFAKGEGVPQSWIKAAEWWRLASSAGSADGKYNLGLLYWEGLGVPVDQNSAIFLWIEASNDGLQRAKKRLTELSANDNLNFQIWMREQSQNPPPQIYSDQDAVINKANSLRPATDQDHSPENHENALSNSNYNIKSSYTPSEINPQSQALSGSQINAQQTWSRSSHIVPADLYTNPRRKTVEKLPKEVESGGQLTENKKFSCTNCQFYVTLPSNFDAPVASCPRCGHIFSISHSKSAESKENQFSNCLAIINTSLSNKDDAIVNAVSVMRRLADDGYPPAQFEVGQLYESGKFWPIDISSAAIWYERAAVQDNLPAKRALSRIYK